MSAIAQTRRASTSLRNGGATVAGGIGLVVLGLVIGKVATSHYEKLALELLIGVPLLGGLGWLLLRQPRWGAITIGSALVIVPNYAAPTVFHLPAHPVLIIGLVIFVSSVLGAVAGTKARLSLLDGFVALFFLFFLFAVVLGPRSLKEAGSQLWLWIPPYLGGRTLATRTDLKRTLARTFVIGLAATTPFALAEAAGLHNPFFYLARGSAGQIWAHETARPGESFRVQASFGHPIAYSMALSVGIILALVLLGEAKSRRARLSYLACIAALFADEVLTLSRSGWVVLGVALLLLAAGRRRGLAGRTARRAIVAGVALVLALALAVPSVAEIPLSLVGLQSDTSSQSNLLTRSTSYRANLYSTTFSNGVPSLFGNQTSKLSGAVGTSNGSIDSEYLNLLDQWGAAPTLLLLAIVIGLTMKSLGNRQDEWDVTFTVAAVGCTVALASVALITNQEYMVWLLIGLSAAPKPLPTTRPPPTAEDSETGAPPWRPETPATARGWVDSDPRTNLQVVASTLRRRWWIVVLCPLIAGGAATAFSKQQPTKYTASASLLFQVPDFDKILYGVPFDAPSLDPNRQQATNRALITLPTIAQRVAAVIPSLSANRVEAEIKVKQTRNSYLYLINVTDRSPVLAARIANEYARQYLQFRQQADRQRIAAVTDVIATQLGELTPLQRKGPYALRLKAQIDRLALISALQTGNAELGSSASPPHTPSAPRTQKTAKYGALGGLLIGLLLVFWIGRRDRRIRDATAVEEAYGTVLIGTVSDEEAAPNGGQAFARSPATEAAFDLLRARLRYFNVDRELNTLMITSAGAGEGRTTLALQLAISSALAGTDRVLLLEADLRHPTLAAALDLPAGPGLTEVLRRDASVDDALVRAEVGDADQDGSVATITVLPAGMRPPNPLELLESERMAELLRSLPAKFDLIVVDSSPLSAVPDALPLLGHVSGVVVAGRIGVTTHAAARSLREQLRQADASVLGVVAMSVPGERSRSRIFGRWRPYQSRPSVVGE